MLGFFSPLYCFSERWCIFVSYALPLFWMQGSTRWVWTCGAYFENVAVWLDMVAALQYLWLCLLIYIICHSVVHPRTTFPLHYIHLIVLLQCLIFGFVSATSVLVTYLVSAFPHNSCASIFCYITSMLHALCVLSWMTVLLAVAAQLVVFEPVIHSSFH